jgi:transcriptional regulator with XRE-family HTH domain
MEKSIHSHEYLVFLKLLKGLRQDAGLSQVTLATKLDETQTFVSKCERGERRIDVIELRIWCQALSVDLPIFLEQLDKELMRQ